MRMTFLCVAVISFTVLAYLLFVFPKIENSESFSISQLPELFTNSRLMVIYIITFLFATGYYTAYSYVEPFLQKVAGFPSSLVTITLMLFGIAGLLGSYLFSKYYDDHHFIFVQAVLFSFAGTLALLYPAAVNMYMIIFVCAIWGIAAMAFQTSFQAEIISCVSTAASSVAMAVFSAIFNLGIGSGTWLGGTVYTNTSLNYIGFVGAVIVLIASIIGFIKFRNK